MQCIQGKNRSQSIRFPVVLDQIVEQDNQVRIIALFVESINLSDLNFFIKTSIEGRPVYHPKDLLKLYVYGYLNSILSNRVLEKASKFGCWIYVYRIQPEKDHESFRTGSV